MEPGQHHPRVRATARTWRRWGCRALGLGGATSGGVGSWWQAAAWVLGGRRRRLFHRADDGFNASGGGDAGAERGGVVSETPGWLGFGR